MARRKDSSSIRFCEWVVGATISSALGPIPKKSKPKPPRRQRVLKVEVTTDNETEEDTVKVSCSRSRRSKTDPATETSAKKVRFDDGPKKSAMKKTTSPASSPEEEGTKESSDAQASSAESSDSSKASDSGEGSEQGSVCPCRVWVCHCQVHKKKQKHKQGTKKKVLVKKRSKQRKASSSDTDEPKKTSKSAKKKGSKDKKKGNDVESSATDTEPTTDAESTADAESTTDAESAADTGDESSAVSDEPAPEKQSKGKKSKKATPTEAETKKSEEAEAEKPSDAEQGEKEPTQVPDKPADENDKTETAPDESADTQKATTDGDRKPGNYPAVFPSAYQPHPFGTPGGLPQNAQYDCENNFARTHYATMYGHYGQPIYAMQDRSHHPIPMGMPHPSQNPYYYGYGQGLGLNNVGQVPITQGDQMPPWNPYYAPRQGYTAAGYPGAYVPQPAEPPQPATDPNPLPFKSNKGAFSRLASLLGKDGGDPAGGNNVFPPAPKENTNPYYPQRRSAFANMGNSHPDGSSGNSPLSSQMKSDKKAKQPRMSHAEEIKRLQKQRDDQLASSSSTKGQGQGTGDAEARWNKDATADQNRRKTWSAYRGDQHASSFDQGTRGSPYAGHASSGNGAPWSTDGQTGKQDGPLDGTNNVMPGGWYDSTPGPSWADPTMAASTKGQVDATSW
ncbi:hypothetical protein E4U32_007610 [Claviceps aff. humidiphila group G2b]|nr:hypothetical protein E4U32_007610 [Claviceps aff. humidiphila group G2b]